MASNNNVNLIGRLTKDPELQKTQQGKSIINFTLAVDSYRKDADGNKKAYFIFCTAWNKIAENIASYTHKGDMIAVSGFIESTSYTDQSGQNRVSFKVQAQDMTLLGTKHLGGEPTAKTASSSQQSEYISNEVPTFDADKYITPESLPF